MNIKSISIIGNEERTLYRICSHFRLSKAKQIRQQLANSREKRGFLYCYFLDNKKNLITLCQRIKWYFVRTDVSRTNHITAFLQR